MKKNTKARTDDDVTDDVVGGVSVQAVRDGDNKKGWFGGEGQRGTRVLNTGARSEHVRKIDE